MSATGNMQQGHRRAVLNLGWAALFVAACGGHVTAAAPDSSAAGNSAAGARSGHAGAAAGGAPASSSGGAPASSSGGATPIDAAGATSSGAVGVGGAIGVGGASGGSPAAGAASLPNGGPYPPTAQGICVPGALKHPDGFCYCQPTSLSYCPGGCVDPSSDPESCGNCGSQCDATAACRDGHCGLTPTTLVPAASGCGSIHLALANAMLYWTDTQHDLVWMRATSGGFAKYIVAKQHAPTSIAARGSTVFWLNTGDNTIARWDGTGVSLPSFTWDDPIRAFTVSADGSQLYFASFQQVVTVATSGGAASELGHEVSGLPMALAIDGNTLSFPTEINGDIDVMSLSGGPALCASIDDPSQNVKCLRIAQSQGGLLPEIAALGGQTFWANGASLDMAPNTASTAFVTTVGSASNDASQITAFTVRKGAAYFADDAGYVLRASLPNGETAALARGQKGVTSIVADDTYTYWATGDCAILRVANQ